MTSEPGLVRNKHSNRTGATWQKKANPIEQQKHTQNGTLKHSGHNLFPELSAVCSVATRNSIFENQNLSELKSVQDEKLSQDNADARTRVKDWIRHRHELLQCRQQNLDAWIARPVSVVKTLDSSIKKTSAFLRKLRSFSLGGEAHVKQLLGELEKLNLSRYGTEMVTAIAETRLARSVDVAFAVQIAGAIHRVYPQFALDLEAALAHAFDGVAQYSRAAEIDKEQAIRWRSSLRLVTDLFRFGVFRTPKLAAAAIKQLIESDQGSDPNCTILSILVGFCRYAGFDFLGILPVKIEADFLLFGESVQALFSKPEDLPVDQETREKCYKSFSRYFSILSDRLAALAREVNHQKKENKRQVFFKGSVDEKHVANLATLIHKVETLKLYLNQLADLIRHDMPKIEMEEDESKEAAALQDDLSSSFCSAQLFDDEETVLFYSSLPDLGAIIPGVLLADVKSDSVHSEAIIIDETSLKEDTIPPPASGGSSSRYVGSFDLFLQSLSNAMNRIQIDEMAERFCHLNNRGTRKRLIETLYLVSRDRLDLLPFYSRFIAILTPCFPDIGSEMVRLLKNQFYGLMRNKSQHNIDSKIKNVRYIGELTKFGIAHHSIAFNAWNFCLNEFTGQRINVCCALLESCGRWLFKNPETNERCSQFLDRMMKLKAAKYIEEHLSNLIENAYYHCKPPAIRLRHRKVYPPMQLYLHHLIYSELNDSMIDDILVLLRQLSWDDATVIRWLTKTLIKPDIVQVQNIKCLASIVAGLDKFHAIAIEIADAILEEIRQGLERNDFTECQRRLAFARYLGELYNYMVVNAQTIFDTLYMIITLGHEIDRNGQLISEIDPPHDTFRVRMVCMILDSCGSYFSGGSKQKRLDRFFLFLQRYLILKTVVPADIDFLVADVFDALSPQLHRYTLLSDVNDAIAKMDKGNVDRLSQLSFPQLSDQQTFNASAIDNVPANDEERNLCKSTFNSEDRFTPQQSDGFCSNEDFRDFNRWDYRKQASHSNDDNQNFELEFDRLVLESVEQRKFEKRTIQNLTDASAFAGSANSVTRKEEGKVLFQLLTRKSNKPQTKTLAIPAEVELAAKSLQEKKNAAEEQNTLKRLVMAGMQREAEEQQRDCRGTGSVLDRHIAVDLSYRNFDPKSLSNIQPTPNRQKCYRGRRLVGRSGSNLGSGNGDVGR